MEGLARRPITHTSEPMLELPNSHPNFCQLREEFTSMLECWKCLNAGNIGTNFIRIIEIGLKLERKKSFISTIYFCLLYCL